MKKSNIIFFTGENQVFLNKDLDKWVELFIQKHGDFNISRFNSENISNINIGSELTTMPFLGSHRLIVLENFPSKSSDKEEKDNKDYDSLILENLDKIPENNIVVFLESFPDKRKTLYKKLLEIAQVKEYNNIEGTDLRNYIRNRLINIDNTAISRLMEYKNSNLNKIEQEIEKLHLYKMNGRITEEDIEKYITPEIDISIFELTDAIIELNKKRMINSFKIILENHNIFQVFSTIMSNLRNIGYIDKLINIGYSKNEIINILKIHPYVFQKNYNTKNKQKLIQLFNKLVVIDKKIKSGEMISDGDNALKLALEKELLSIN